MDLGNIAGNLSSLPKLKEVWDDIQDKNWSGLMESLRNHKDDDGGKHKEMLDDVEAKARQAQDEGKEFPNSPEDLMKLIHK